MLRTSVFASVVMLSLTLSARAEPLLVCGWDEVFLIETSTARNGKVEKLWTWNAKASKELPEPVRASFATTDDCKPLDGGSKVLISSSSGGCALVERPSGHVLWYALVPNAHSLELLPRGRVVVASSVSQKGNRLILFDLARSNEPIWDTPLVSAHGVVWDENRQRLWTLGLKDLRSYELKDWESQTPSLGLTASYVLPGGDGHDLQAVPHSNDLVVTTGPHVYLFDRDKHEFRLHPDLGNKANVKCVSIHPVRGQTVFVHAAGKEWWTDTLGLLAPVGTIQMPGEHLYKARWLVPAPAKGDGATDAAPKPLFRFVQVNDLHVQAAHPALRSPQQQTYKDANVRARWVLNAIEDRMLLPSCDFVVGVGDLIHGEELDRLEPDLKALGELLKPLRCPFYPVIGNHEVVQQERSPEHLQPYRKAFGKDRVDYTFAWGGVQFVVLNNGGAPNPQAAKQRNLWLRRALSGKPDQPTIIFCHVPLIPLRGEQAIAKSFGLRIHRSSFSFRLDKSVCHKPMPHPMSLPARCGYNTPRVATTAPIGAPLPGCKSGMPTTWTAPGSCATRWSCVTASPTIQLFGEATTRTAGAAFLSAEFGAGV